MSNQGELYDRQYDESVYDEQGLPDLKIVDYKKNVRGRKILSVGAGMVADLWYLVDKNEVHALDSSKKAVKVAKKHGVKARLADARKKLPYSDDMFDVVVLKDILEHLLEPELLLQESKRVLKKRGYMIISLPNHFWWWFRIRMLFGKNLLWKTLQHDHSREQEEWNYMHVRFFTWKGIQELLAKNHLKIDKAYWDLGTLAHYSDIEMFYQVIKNKKNKSKQAKIFLNYVYPLYAAFNFFLPKRWRAEFVSLNPGLLCAGFYLRVRK